MATLHNLVKESVSEHSTSVAVAYDDGNFKSYVTYQELLERAEVICGLLRSLDVYNETIGLCMPQNSDLPAVTLAILQTPASFYPFDGDGPEFVRQSLVKLRVRYLLVHFDLLQSVDELTHLLCGEVVPCMELLEFGLVLIAVSTSDRSNVQAVKQVSDLAYCITTSGTTSSPKVVRVPHQCIVPNITQLRDIYKVTRDDVCFLSSPLTFDPSIVEMFVALTSGATLLITSKEVKASPKKLLDVIYHRNSVSILQTTPALLFRSSPSDLKSTLFSSNSSLRLLALGGEKFPSLDVLQRVVPLDSPIKFVNLYGITEVSTWATYFAFDADYMWKTKQDIPLGSTMSGTKVKVVDAKGQEVTHGEGELTIGSSSRCCLLNDETPEDVLNTVTWRHTGDIVYKSEDGVISYIGRTDGQIKRLGKRLNTDAVEHSVLQLPTVTDCRVLHYQNHLLLFLVARQPITEIHHATFKMEVTTHLQKVLPSHYQPDELILTDSFPVTKHGKTDVKFLLSSWVSAHKVKDTQADDVKLWCQEMWMDVLMPHSENTNMELELFSITDSSEFLALGGDSLKAVNMVSTIEKCLGCTRSSLLDTVLNRTFKDFVEDVQEFHGQGQGVKQPISSDHGFPKFDESVASKTVHAQGIGDTSRHFDENMMSKEQGDIKKPKRSPDMTNLDDSVPAKSVESKGLQSYCRSSHFDNEDDQENMSENKDPNILFNANTQLKSGNSSESDAAAFSSQRTEDTMSPFESISIDSRSPDLTESVSVNSQTSPGTVQRKIPAETDSPFIGSLSRGNRHQGAIPEEAPHITAGSPKLEMMWKYDTGKCVDASCLVALAKSGEHVVYIGSHSHAMCAIQLTSGTEMWRTRLGDRVESTACLGKCGRWVVVGCYDNNVYVLCAISGKIYWKYRTEGCVKSSPTVDLVTSHIIFGSHDHCLHAINIEKKQRVWMCPLQSGSVFSSPCVSQYRRHVYVGSLGGVLHAVNADTGKLVWSSSTDKPIFSSPAENRSCVVIGCVDASIYCFNHDGHKLWTYQTQAPVFSSPTITTLVRHQKREKAEEEEENEVILVGSHDKHLYCISQSGQLVWKWQADSAIYATPFVGRTRTSSKALLTKEVELPFDERVERSRSFGTLQEKEVELPFDERVERSRSFGTLQEKEVELPFDERVERSRSFGTLQEKEVENQVNVKETNEEVYLSKVTQSEEDLRIAKKVSIENKLHFQTEMSNGVTFPMRKIKAKSLSWLDEEMKSDVCGVCAAENKLVGLDGEPFIKKLRLESLATRGTFVCRSCGKTSSKTSQKLVPKDGLCSCESEKTISLANKDMKCHNEDNYVTVTEDMEANMNIKVSSGTHTLNKSSIHVSTSSVKDIKIETDSQAGSSLLTKDTEYCIGQSLSATKGQEANGQSPLVCVASTSGQLVLLDGSGYPLFSVHLPGEVFSSPVIVDGFVVVGCRDNNVYCYRIVD